MNGFRDSPDVSLAGPDERMITNDETYFDGGLGAGGPVKPAERKPTRRTHDDLPENVQVDDRDPPPAC